MLGWEPETVTTYSYDTSGRLVESRTETEPEWDDEQRGLMLALRVWEADSLCSVCGGPKSECQSMGDASFWDVPPPTRCHRITAVELQAEKYREAKVPRALVFSAQPKATGQRP